MPAVSKQSSPTQPDESLTPRPSRLSKDELPVQRDWFALHRDLSNTAVAALAGKGRPKILEAGCGRKWSLNLKGLNPYIVGLDVDEDALRLRVREKKDLDEYIVGDLASAEFPDASFDMIYCSYVLEHIEKANDLLCRMYQWLRPGGLLVIKIPLRDTAFGFLTRNTPLRAHVLYHRVVLGVADAGKPGHSPYPVYYDPVVSLSGMQDFLDKRNIEVLYATTTDFTARQNRVLRYLAKAISETVAVLSFGKLTSEFSGLAFVAQKNPNENQRQAKMAELAVFDIANP